MAEKKTVGDILREQGLIKERPKPEKIETPKYKFEQEVDLKRIVMDLEKLSAEVNAIKEIKFHSEERIRDLSEKIGELRSMVFQRESFIKEIESKTRLIEESISDVEPKKITKEMEKRKQEIEETTLKIERLETMNRELLGKIRDIERVTGNIKSVENLMGMLDRIEKDVAKSEKIKADIDRFAGKSERFYIEMENRVKEFPELKMKLEKVDDLTRELTKTIDEVNIKLAGFVPREDMNTFKKGLENVIISSRESLDSRIRAIEEILNVPSDELLAKRNSLRAKRDNVSRLLANIEEQYRRNEITKNAYDEIKQRNDSLIKTLDVEIKKLEDEEAFSLKSLPSIINDIQEGFTIMENKMKSIEEQKIDVDLKTQTEITKNMLGKLKEVSKKINGFELKMNFFEILNMIMRVESVRDISFYVSELERTVAEMKESGLWDDKRYLLVRGILVDVGNAWHNYGYDDIAQIFADGIRNISVPAVPEPAEPENPPNTQQVY